VARGNARTDGDKSDRQNAREVLADLLRGKDRQRRSLYQKIRRLIAANAELATWKDNDGNLVCGYAAWRSAVSVAIPAPSQLNWNSTQRNLIRHAKRLLASPNLRPAACVAAALTNRHFITPPSATR
jgi:hypothetical protein